VIHLSLCDSLPAYGPITDLTFALAKNGVSPVLRYLCATMLMKCPVSALLQDRFVPELVTATGSGLLGGFTLFQVRSRISPTLSVTFSSQYITSISFGVEAGPSDPHETQIACYRRRSRIVVAPCAHGG
jgi:hypothetical protein